MEKGAQRGERKLLSCIIESEEEVLVLAREGEEKGDQ